jgi:hypothetical protein
LNDAQRLRELERRLWQAADQLRANSKLRAADYSIPALGLIFLRLTDIYDRRIYSEKCARVFQHIFESYQGAGKSIYEEAA